MLLAGIVCAVGFVAFITADEANGGERPTGWPLWVGLAGIITVGCGLFALYWLGMHHPWWCGDMPNLPHCR